jgi:hypothetical protein
MKTAVLIGLVVAVPATAQRSPDLSGRWEFAGGITTSSRTSSDNTPRSTTSNTISGAAFNCGRECTILQKGQTLTIADAHLAARPNPAQAITIRIDGRPAAVTDTFSPSRALSVTAKWNGEKLEVATASGAHTVRQTIYLDAKELVVVTAVEIGDIKPVTFRYRKK